MVKANATESTSLIAQCDNNLPDNEKESTIPTISHHEKSAEDDPIEDRTHLIIFLTALVQGVLTYILYIIFYPPLVRLIYFILTSKAMDDDDSDDGMNPLSFSIMMFFL